MDIWGTQLVGSLPRPFQRRSSSPRSCGPTPRWASSTRPWTRRARARAEAHWKPDAARGAWEAVCPVCFRVLAWVCRLVVFLRVCGVFPPFNLPHGPFDRLVWLKIDGFRWFGWALFHAGPSVSSSKDAYANRP